MTRMILEGLLAAIGFYLLVVVMGAGFAALGLV